MQSFLRSSLLCVLLIVFSSSLALAQPVEPLEKPKKPQPLLQSDYGIFRSADSTKIRLEIYYQVYNFGLEFVKSGDDFVARYAIKLTLVGNANSQIDTTIERSILVKRREQTTSRFDFRTSQLHFDIESGNYTAMLTVIDRATGEERKKEWKIRAELDDRRMPSLSSLELIQKVDQIEETDSSIFRKGNLGLVPSVVAAFGGTDSARLTYYHEIYPARNQKPGDTDQVVIETRLRHDARGLVYRDTLHVKLAGEIVRQLRTISLSDLPPGGYDMEVYLRGRRMVEIDRETKRVIVLWDQEQQIKNDWKTILQQLSYIAAGSELRSLKSATTVEERRAAFDQFWLQRDPTVGSAENEEKREFYRRINQANVRFTVGRRDGWKTDRGRIFVQQGEPDRVDDVYFSPTTQPYQVWHYYQRGEYLRFLFVDEDQDGDYRLFPPYDGRGMRPDF